MKTTPAAILLILIACVQVIAQIPNEPIGLPGAKGSPAVREVSTATQIEVLSRQLDIAAADKKAAPFEEAVHIAQMNAQASISQANAECNVDERASKKPDAFDAVILEHKVSCQEKPKPAPTPAPDIGPGPRPAVIEPTPAPKPNAAKPEEKK
jgi:hypothetical protein